MTIMPCQCGARSEPDLVQIKYTAEQESWQVRCLRCKASSPACDSQAAAINAWNRLALSVNIAEAAWLERETNSARHGWSQANHWRLWGCAHRELRRLLDQWEEEFE